MISDTSLSLASLFQSEPSSLLCVVTEYRVDVYVWCADSESMILQESPTVTAINETVIPFYLFSYPTHWEPQHCSTPEDDVTFRDLNHCLTHDEQCHSG